ncbi:MAG: DSD1 family PLP-dependent enzyme [Candidatus Latescibacteria bacterium]|nr:DSD1 family PLP-dependent enzyme [Candidatus Latescibacterota bacterium]
MPHSQSYLGQPKEAIDTPALLVDLDLFEANIQRIASYCQTHLTQWRPHSKAHKSPAIAHLLLQAGAWGITCAKVSEAAVMVQHGVDNILIANQLATPTKLARIAALQHKAKVLSTLDTLELVDLTAAAAQAEGTIIPVLIDIDIGMNRTGIPPGQPCLELAEKIISTPGLSLEGIMGYEGHVLDISPPAAKETACHKALDHLLHCRDLLEKAGIPVSIISAGGTGCYQLTAAYSGITEIQAGGGIFMDALYRDTCHIDDLQPALTVLATVTSRHQDHIVTDAGFKTMSSYHQAPVPLHRPELSLNYLSAEHGVLDIAKGHQGPAVGEQVEFLVGYSDSTNVLHDRFLGLRQGQVEIVWDILGRGQLT